METFFYLWNKQQSIAFINSIEFGCEKHQQTNCCQHVLFPVCTCHHSLSARVIPCLHVSFPVCTCHFLSARVISCLDVSFPVCTGYSISARVIPSLQVSFPVCTCHSLSAPVIPCLHGSFPVCTCQNAQNIPELYTWKQFNLQIVFNILFSQTLPWCISKCYYTAMYKGMLS